MEQDNITHNHGNEVNIYIVYEISRNFNISVYLTPEICLFGAVSLTKNADIDKWKYSGYGIGFDWYVFYSHPSGGTGKNEVIFAVDMIRLQRLITGKNIFWGKGPTQELEHTLSAEKMYSITFTEHNKKFHVSLLKMQQMEDYERYRNS